MNRLIFLILELGLDFSENVMYCISEKILYNSDQFMTDEKCIRLEKVSIYYNINEKNYKTVLDSGRPWSIS
jgi:hypothetical protein